jgi:hypothetical protein
MQGTSSVVAQAEEIADEEHERILERVCAIGVGKESGKVCTQLPGTAPVGVARWGGGSAGCGMYRTRPARWSSSVIS